MLRPYTLATAFSALAFGIIVAACSSRAPGIYTLPGPAQPGNAAFRVYAGTTSYYDALGDSVTGCTHYASGVLTHPTVCPVAGAGNVTMYPQLMVNAWKAAGSTFVLHDLAVSGEGIQTYTSCFITANSKPLTVPGFTASVPPYPPGANQLKEVNALDSDITVGIGFDELAVRAADSIEGCSKLTAAQIANLMFSEFSSSYATIRKTAPHALIVVINEANGQKIPNANLRAFSGGGHTIYLSDLRMNAYYSAWIKKLDTFSATNAFVADTACQAFAYNKADHGTDIHLNQAGQQATANYLLSDIKLRTHPNTSCTYVQ